MCVDIYVHVYVDIYIYIRIHFNMQYLIQEKLHCVSFLVIFISFIP